VKLEDLVNDVEKYAPVARAIATYLAPNDMAAVDKAVGHAKTLSEREEKLGGSLIVAFWWSRTSPMKGVDAFTSFMVEVNTLMRQQGEGNGSTGVVLGPDELALCEKFWAVRNPAANVAAAVAGV